MTKPKPAHEKIVSGQSPKMACPNCDGRVIVSNGKQITRTYREITYLCTVPECAFSFVAELNVVRWLSPSGQPNPRLRLPGPNGPPRKVPPEPYDQPPDATALDQPLPF